MLSQFSESITRHLTTLARSIAGIHADFACGGEVPVEEPLTFGFAEGKPLVMTAPKNDGSVLELVRYDEHISALAKKLKKLCARAPFGAGTETRMDPRVRDAFQLRAANGAMTIEGFDPQRNGVLAHVQSALAPRDPNPLVAELYGLNIYSSGGHFAPHKDTPRGDTMLGTLVVCLPTDFSGGALCVCHNGIEKRFDWQRPAYRNPTPAKYQWAAYFGDVDHEVRSVYSGERVTLTWLLRRTEGAVLVPPPAGTTTERFASALGRAVQDPEFFLDGAQLGVPCVHLYTRSFSEPLEAEELTAQSALRLKGRDQDIALGALSAGLAVRLAPMITERNSEQHWLLKRFLTPKEIALFDRKRITDSDIEERLPVTGGAEFDTPSVDAWLPGAPMFHRSRAEHAPQDSVALRYLGDLEYSNTGYFGNEGGPGEFYAYAALVISIPSRKPAIQSTRQS